MRVPGGTDDGGEDVSVRVLGGLVAQVNGAEVDLGGRRQRGVLALLLLARGAALAPERLADLLWGENPPAGAAGALQSYVSHLRRALEPDRGARTRDSVIVRERAGYACRLPAEAVDAWRFERLVGAATDGTRDLAARIPVLEAAVDLYRGDGYAEWAGERWADAERARLRELHAVARERLLAARLERDDPAVLVPELETLAADEPLHEERWRLLALALYRANRQSDALAALRRARTTLRDELGIDPGPALRELESRILAHDASLTAPPRATPVSPLPPAPQLPPHDRIVDREAELAQLRDQVRVALAGSGGAVVIEGPPGIGKSRLLAEARRMGETAGAVVLGARGSVLEREYAFGAVRQLLEPLLVDEGARARLLAGSAASSAGVFDVLLPDQRAEGSFAALHGLYWLVVNLAADRPVVLAIDDLHWCDPASLRFLAYLLRRVEGLPVLVAATLRTGEEPVDAALVAEVAHDPVAVAVQPGPLRPESVERLVHDRLGGAPAPAFVAACHRTTGGNPLLLRQLLRALETDGVRPDTAHADTVVAIGSRAVSSIVVTRLARMPRQARDVASAVAVLGDGAALPAVAALSGLDEVTAADAVADLARGEILRAEHPLGFVHPLVGDAVYRSLPPGHRELAHERAARVLDARGEPPERVAAHLLQVPARGDAWVVETLRHAAAVATDRGAPEGAVAYLTRALAEPPADLAVRAQVLLELGSVEILSNGDAAIGHLERAYALASDVGARARAAQVLGHSLVFAGPRGRIVSFVRQAVAELPDELGDLRQGLLALERVGAHMHGLSRDEWMPPPLPRPAGHGPGSRMLRVAQAWELLKANGDRQQVVTLCRDALRDNVLQETDPGLFWVVAAFLQEMADEDLGDFWDDMLRLAHQRGSLFSAMATHMWRGHAQWQQGDLREAEQSFRTAIEQSERWAAPPIAASYGEAFIVSVLLDRGDVSAARRFFDARSGHPRMGDGARLHVEAEVGLLLAEARPAAALTRLEAAGALLTDVVNPVWSPWRSLRGRALSELGRVPEAEAVLTDELSLARSWGSSRPIGRSLRLLGQLRGAAGEDLLREAVAVLEPSPWRLELALAAHALAAVAPRAEAHDLLARALELCEACGADGLRAEVARDLAAAGARVPEQTGRRVRLTTTQRRVATMAVDGADVREIAASLFLTPRSVEVTLDSAREALGVSNDAELRFAMAT